MQVQARVAQVPRNGGAVVAPAARPLEVVHAQAVDLYQHPLRHGGKGRAERRILQLERLAVVPEAHRNREGIAGHCQVIADHAVQRR